MDALDTQVVAVRLEHGAGLAALELGVLIVVVAVLDAQRAEAGKGVAQLAGEVPRVLLQFDRHVGLRDRAIVGVELRVRDARVALVAQHDRSADAEGVRIALAVRQPARRAGLAALGLHRPGPRAAGDSQVLVLRRIAIDMQHERLVPGVHPQAAGREVVRAAVAIVGSAGYRRGEALLRDPAVDGVDHAADRVAAVHHRCRPAHDLDSLGRKGRHGDRMIGARRRGVDDREAVVQHADVERAQAADDRAARIRTEVGRAHADLARERFADGGLLLEPQALALQHVDRLYRREQLGPDWRGGDDGGRQRLWRCAGALLSVRAAGERECDRRCERLSCWIHGCSPSLPRAVRMRRTARS